MSTVRAATAPTDLTQPGVLESLRLAFEEREPEVLSFLPEEGRWDRLADAVTDLVRRWPDPARRPPLFGLPVGIKDIF
ncbi:MAG TPA: hypothetical protein VGS57_22155, partial [Thermoanaerobaculia bacterium]|nr:hypothetical protein [Thermoanaerobaculia bacterium]